MTTKPQKTAYEEIICDYDFTNVMECYFIFTIHN